MDLATGRCFYVVDDVLDQTPYLETARPNTAVMQRTASWRLSASLGAYNSLARHLPYVVQRDI